MDALVFRNGKREVAHGSGPVMAAGNRLHRDLSSAHQQPGEGVDARGSADELAATAQAVGSAALDSHGDAVVCSDQPSLRPADRLTDRAYCTSSFSRASCAGAASDPRQWLSISENVPATFAATCTSPRFSGLMNPCSTALSKNRRSGS